MDSYFDGEIVDELKSEQSISVLLKSIISVNMVTPLAYYTNKRIANLDLNETSVSVVEIYAYIGFSYYLVLGTKTMLISTFCGLINVWYTIVCMRLLLFPEKDFK